MQKAEATHSMKEISIDKVTLNIGVGEIGEGVEKAVNLLEKLTGKEAKKTKADKKAKTFGVREGLEIGAKVSLRGKKAEEFLKKALKSKNNKVKSKWFDTQGNFSFGIDEYFNLPDTKYDPEIGIIGFDIAVTLERPGFSVRNRGNEIGDKQRISKEEAMEFIKKKFDIEVE